MKNYPGCKMLIHFQLFEDIMNILDPEMNFVDDEEGSLAEEDEEAIESDAGSSKQSGQKDKSGDDRSELREYVSELYFVDWFMSYCSHFFISTKGCYTYPIDIHIYTQRQ